MTESNFYWLFFADDVAALVAPEEALLPTVKGGEPLEAPWEGVSLFLQNRHLLRDQHSSDVGWRIVSPAMRNVIETVAGNEAGTLSFLPMTITTPSERILDYSILHFSAWLDALNRQETVFSVGDVWIRPVIDNRSAEGHHIFVLPKRDISVFVSCQLKNALEEAGVTGVDFSPALTS